MAPVADVIKYAVLTALTVAVIYLPFVVLGGSAWIVASFMMLARSASYSTSWALIDGNWLPGDAGPLTNRIQLDAIDHLPGNPAVIPGVIVIAVFAITYLWFARRPSIDRARRPLSASPHSPLRSSCYGPRAGVRNGRR